MVPTLLASQGGTKHSQEIKDSSVFCKLQIVFQTNKCYCCVLSPETQESTVTGFGWEWVEFGGGEACFPETQFYLGLPEGHQQVTHWLARVWPSGCQFRRQEGEFGKGEGKVATTA